MHLSLHKIKRSWHKSLCPRLEIEKQEIALTLSIPICAWMAKSVCPLSWDKLSVPEGSSLCDTVWGAGLEDGTHTPRENCQCLQQRWSDMSTQWQNCLVFSLPSLLCKVRRKFYATEGKKVLQEHAFQSVSTKVLSKPTHQMSEDLVMIVEISWCV